MSKSDKAAFNKGQNEAIVEVANNVADEIPIVGEVKAYKEGGVKEMAIGFIPGGKKIKKVLNKLFKSRKGALRQAKRDTEVPNSSDMAEIKPDSLEGKELGLDKRNKRAYVGENTDGNEVIIREDKPAKYGAPGGEGDQGSHFNTSVNGQDTKIHYNYPDTKKKN